MRVGRFEFHGAWRAPLKFSGIEIKCDHSNGDEAVYYFPNITTEDARDLMHGLNQLLKQAENETR